MSGARRIADILIGEGICSKAYHARAQIILGNVSLDGRKVTYAGATLPPGRHKLEVTTRAGIRRIEVNGNDDFRV